MDEINLITLQGRRIEMLPNMYLKSKEPRVKKHFGDQSVKLPNKVKWALNEHESLQALFVYIPPGIPRRGGPMGDV